MTPFLTNSGLSKLAVATPLAPMTVKYMAFGTGTGTPTENMEALFTEVHRVEIPDPIRDLDNPKNILFTGTLTEAVGGWTITEIGLLDDAGSLIAYWLLDSPVVKPAPGNALKMAFSPDLIISLSNAEQVDLIITSSTLYRHNSMTERDAADAHPIKSITGLQGALDQKDTNLNNQVGVINQSIATTNTDIATKDAQNVKITGNQTIAGIKKFTGQIDVPLIRSADGTSEMIIANGSIMIRTTASGRTAQVLLDPENNMIDLGTMTLFGNGSGLDSATASKKGVVQLNDTLTSTSAALALTAAQGKALNDKMMGVSQTWQDVTASRVAGTTYTNSTARPIMVTVTVLAVTGTDNHNLYVGNVIVSGSQDQQAGDYTPYSTIVPAGATYRMTVEAGTISRWVELR